jgi:hypothetical protein
MSRADLILDDFPESLIPRIDQYGRRLAEANPGAHFTRTDCVTALLVRGLAEIEGAEVAERRQASGGRKPRRHPDRRKVVRRGQDRVVQHTEVQLKDLLQITL